jgi:hypothetical protein
MTMSLFAAWAAVGLMTSSLFVFSVLCIIRLNAESSGGFYALMISRTMDLSAYAIAFMFASFVVDKLSALVAFIFSTRNQSGDAVAAYYIRAKKEIEDESAECKAGRAAHLEVTLLMKELLVLEIQKSKDKKPLSDAALARFYAFLDKNDEKDSSAKTGSQSEDEIVADDSKKQQRGDASPACSSGCSAASTA